MAGWGCRSRWYRHLVDAIHAVRDGGRFVSQEIAQAVIEDCLRGQPPASALDVLSLRERQVLQLLVEGKPGAAIAQTLFLSPKTVETYRSRMMQKLNIGNVPELVKFAIQQGLTTIE